MPTVFRFLSNVDYFRYQTESPHSSEFLNDSPDVNENAALDTLYAPLIKNLP